MLKIIAARFSPYQYKNTKIGKKETQNKEVTNPIVQENIGVPVSYISFKGKEEKLNFTPDAVALIERAENVAKERGQSEITPYHILEASILETHENFNKLTEESSEEIEIETLSALNELANNFSKDDILSDNDKLETFLNEVENLQTNTEAALDKIPAEKEDSEIELSQEIKNQIAKSTDGKIDAINGYIVLGAAFNALAAKGVSYPTDFLKTFISMSHFKGREELSENYEKYYNTRAMDIWDKLALGSSLFVTYADEKEADRTAASIVKTLKQTKKGGFSDKNTLIYNMSDDIQMPDFIKEVEDIAENTPNKTKIFIANIDNLLLSTRKNDDDMQVYYPQEFFDLVNKNDDVKFIFLQEHDANFQAMQNSIIKRGFSNFLTYSIPPIRTYETQEIFTKNKSLRNNIKTPFTKDARDKAILYADKLDGIFPDKALDLMNRIARYYGETRKKINSHDVDEFAELAKELFNNDKKNAEIIYNTGKNLSSLYGKDTTKKDLEAIVRQIKTGKIGTRGYIMYSKDPEAGSGRRHTAQALAGEAKVPFIEIASSDFATSIDDDETGDRTSPKVEMNKIFTEIKKAAEQNEFKTAILFVNNFEDFAFSGPYLAGYKQAMAQMEKEMSKAEAERLNIVVIGSTDEYYADAIPTVVRGFSQNIAIDTPAFNKNSRKEIIQNRLKEADFKLDCRTNEQKEFLINKLVKLTEYMSFVEIKTMLEKAEQIMRERGKSKASIGEFIEAYLQLMTGRTSRPEMPEYNKRATTSHECGHAVNLEVMNEILKEKGKPWHQFRDVNFITLDPRGNFLGAVFEGKGENSDYPFEAMFTGLVCAYGGYSCEKMFFDMDGSSGISQDLAQASSSAKQGIEYFGFGHNTGKISNAAGIKSGKYAENVFKDMNVILTNAQMASDLITETYKGFNQWFTDKYSKLIGTDDCMIDGDDFRAILAKWKNNQTKDIKEEIAILGDMIMDIIKASKEGKIYGKLKVVK